MKFCDITLNLRIFIVLTPEYEGRPEDESLKVYFTNQVYLKARQFYK